MTKRRRGTRGRNIARRPSRDGLFEQRFVRQVCWRCDLHRRRPTRPHSDRSRTCWVPAGEGRRHSTRVRPRPRTTPTRSRSCLSTAKYVNEHLGGVGGPAAGAANAKTTSRPLACPTAGTRCSPTRSWRSWPAIPRTRRRSSSCSSPRRSPRSRPRPRRASCSRPTAASSPTRSSSSRRRSSAPRTTT